MSRWTSALLLAAVLTFVAPLVGAQDEGATARAGPPIVAPGQDMTLVLRIDSPELAEVVVQEDVSCTVAFPDDRTREPCQQSGGLAEVYTTGSGAREYAFDYQAPQLEGDYELEFEADSTARIMPGTYTATTSFAVDASAPSPADADDPEAPGDDTEPPGDVDRPPSDGDGDGADTDADGGEGLDALDAGSDTSRMAVSTTLATGVLTVAVVANRFPLGG